MKPPKVRVSREKPTPYRTQKTPQFEIGTLMIIGGHEDRKGSMRVLEELARLIGDRKLCVTTIASRVGEELWQEYFHAFTRLGLKNISHLNFRGRHEANSEASLGALEGAGAVFFTGGDQLRITSDLGGTLAEMKIRKIFHEGGIVAGTSAGASVMSNTMLIAGNEGSFRVGGGLRMAPGLGFLDDVIIDQHFMERGRWGRLLGALAHNPKYLGIGIDENTAIIVEKRETFRVVGSGCVYIADARESDDSNISDSDDNSALSLFNLKNHLLSAGDHFNLLTRIPTSGRTSLREAKIIPEAIKKPAALKKILRAEVRKILPRGKSLRPKNA
ncbi:MAG: cyanophycinase [Cryobacterium sp.]|nr:cyanophycinase [Oligoflexia bacterium]